MTPTHTAIAIVLSGSLGVAQGLFTDCHDFRGVDGEMQRLVQQVARGGAGLSIARDGELLMERFYGRFGETTQVPIASATKWLSGAVIMSLVDDGLLDLDAPVSRYLPEFQGQKGTMTTRQMFSHTAGLPGSDAAVGDRNLTLAQAVSSIAANTPLRVAPGTDFYYGGVSMHVAGRVAEVVGGKGWSELFQDRVAVPLGMTATDYGGIGALQNPRIAGGAQSTLRDYARFMEMIENEGEFRGRRVLSARAVRIMLADQTNGVPVTYVPPTYQGGFRGYGVGCWMERIDTSGVTLEATSPGAFGFTGWIDRQRGTAGVFMVRSVNGSTDPFADRVRDLTRAQLRYRGIDCYGTSASACAGPLRIRSNRAPRSGAGAFAMSCENAPPAAAGVALFAARPLDPPRRILGIDLFVALGPATIGESVVADSRGASTVSVPLTSVAVGALAFVQFAYLPTGGCGSSTPLATSHAVRLEVW